MFDVNAGLEAQETLYRGYRFRSRTEAKWAAMLDALDLGWLYEAQGYDTTRGFYLPDFFVFTPYGGFWLEIKGVEPTETEIKKLGDVCEATCCYGALVWGPPKKGSATSWLSMHKEGHPWGEELDNPVWASLLMAQYGKPDDRQHRWDEGVRWGYRYYLEHCGGTRGLDSARISTCWSGLPRTGQDLGTFYRGVRFTNRIEARWAVLLDYLGARWRYKPRLAMSAHSPTFEISAATGYVFYLDVHAKEPAPASDSMLDLYALCQTTGEDGGAVWGDPSSSWASCIGATSYDRNNGLVGPQRNMPWVWQVLSEHAEKNSASPKDDDQIWCAAVEAARSARFEHGESPKLPSWVQPLLGQG